MTESSQGFSHQPHSRYPHVYAIVRNDAGAGELEDRLSITKVFRSETKAEDEARRLRQLNSEKGCQYFVLQTRLVE